MNAAAAAAAWAWNKKAHWTAVIERTRRILSRNQGLLAQPEPNWLPSLTWQQKSDGQTQPEWPRQTSSSKSTAEFKLKNLKTLAESTTLQIQSLKLFLSRNKHF